MDEIYEKYSKIVYNYLLSLSRNSELSQDLMQETFYLAIRNINEFKGECSIKTWLCKIAQNTWRNYLKKLKSKEMIPYDDSIEDLEKMTHTNSAEAEVLNKNNIINLYKNIHKLNEKTKEVIYLRLNSNLSFKDIGDILGKSENWARITFHRGKVKLKEEFESEK